MKTYSERAALCTNSTAQRLLTLMDEKQTNLCVSADITCKDDLLRFVDAVGPEICLLKTHIDTVKDFDQDLIVQLQRLSEQHNFLIFEDRKFADIGNTVQHQYRNGVYHIADWAHITNAHSLPGFGIVKGLKEVGLPKGRGLLLLAQMTPEGNLITREYTKKTIEMAQAHADFVIGFISTEKLTDDERFIHMTPGVHMQASGDTLGQRYLTPQMVIGEKKSDIVIVGRGIYLADDPVIAAQKYRQAGWGAYTK